MTDPAEAVLVLTDQDPAGCEAKNPAGPRNIWVQCGGPVHARHVYTCACGAHRHIQVTCVSHQPIPGQVGCALCWQAGHECGVTATLIGRDQ